MKLIKKIPVLLICSQLLAYSHVLHAELTIEITEGVQSAHKIAVVPFAVPQGDKLTTDIGQIISQDLAGSGYFNVLAREEMLSHPTRSAQVKFRNWAAIGQDYLVIGFITKDNNLYHIQMSLFDVYKKEQLKGLRITVEATSVNMAAHHLSDAIYQKITGIPGVFRTRIAYVTSVAKAQNKHQYNLHVADYDGANATSIAQSKEPIMSPAWSPDGGKIAYVSFENKVSEIFIQTLATGERKSVAKYKGINGSPAWSPDGKQLAITLSKDGNSDIYILTLADLSLRKLTRSYAIDTEAAWSPDGKEILFTSDRGSRAQIYIMPSNGQGSAERISFDGNYNARGAFSADGKTVVMVQGAQGNYRIAVLDLATRTNTVLTNGPLDESPGFSPNGQTIIYARRKGQNQILSTVTLDGLTKLDIQHTTGNVREPAWASRK
ncbi:Tol-Pal system beta propeller repeat protein TolB [Methylococcaceae bacterium HT4]|nr:Tol-Pal system beta propeller repeat protein TolB [Methyloprofundus sp.]TXK97086.1 Tol-Pal system beta propeller repeat protein TolB [Methylococcaceae bacterium CS4]TXK99392.1 Tol-Pal system beta propeller repeat protein TolB [Methylococcaceae bacterium CS5]TXL05053.1 Tol-Pal system beta propeller repeat protein TolB [Methylococcaceae bacterium CS1]TXL05482.1 Tol-Pal system beta propeller repeat protein TolB [Methylococcaceae bacterium CS3]TXL10005.1 Tol-Pal system beta propeller repeat pro